MEHETVIKVIQRWVAEIVIGLELCPFAKRVFDAGRIRWAVSDAREPHQLREDLVSELKLLVAAPMDRLETTLLIHPYTLTDFLDYNDFLDVADQVLAELDLEGVVQIASFHPQYRFADAEVDAVENYTNRSPYPMLHLLREESVSAVAADEAALEEIPRRNVEVMRALGQQTMIDKLQMMQNE